MVLFNYALKELTAKIVYYGPGLSGKTSNLQYIYEELPIKNKGRMLTLATETDRTLYFDFLPVDAGVVRGIKTRVQLYTVPGQVFYNATRRMVLKGADGVVFVADSQKSMVEANLESFDNLRENLKAHDLKLEEMPLVLQFNKRDLKEICTLEEMNDSLNRMNGPFYEAVAKDGIGVEETLQAISGLVLKSVIDRYGGDRTMNPLGSIAPVAKAAASDPARTDPDALVSATALVSGGAEAGKTSSGGNPPRGKDPKPKSGAWPAPQKEDKVPSKGSNPLDAFESLNIEGILDEALRLDEPDEAPIRPAPRHSKAKPKPEPVPAEEDESMFSGLLDDALGTQETESILDTVLGVGGSSNRHGSTPAPRESDPLREIDLLGESLEPVEEEEEEEQEQEDNRSHLSELIKTKVSIAADRHITGPAREVPKAAAPIEVPIEVPVTLHIDADADEQEIEVILKIRLKRK